MSSSAPSRPSRAIVAVGDRGGERAQRRGPRARQADAARAAPSRASPAPGRRASGRHRPRTRAASRSARRADRTGSWRRGPSPAGRARRAPRARTDPMPRERAGPAVGVRGRRGPGERPSARPIWCGSASRSNRRRARATSHWIPSRRGQRQRQLDLRGVRQRPQRQRTHLGADGDRAPVAVPSTASTPGIARSARKPSSAVQSSGGRYARRRRSPAGTSRRRRPRSARGDSRNVARIAWLNWRTLAKPAEIATSTMRRSVSSSRRRARWTRVARATAPGAAPRCASKSRRRCRPLTPRRSANDSMSSSSRAPPRSGGALA